MVVEKPVRLAGEPTTEFRRRQVMWLIELHGPASFDALFTRWRKHFPKEKVSPSTMQRSIASLHEREWIYRMEDNEDRRVVLWKGCRKQ